MDTRVLPTEPDLIKPAIPNIRPFPMAFPITASVSFIFLFFSYTTLSFPLVPSPLARLLDIQRREQSPPSVQLAAARGLLSRLLPSHISSFDFEIVSKVVLANTTKFLKLDDQMACVQTGFVGGKKEYWLSVSPKEGLTGPELDERTALWHHLRCKSVKELCGLILFTRIQGTTGVELSAGLHWYLKHWCWAHISWEKSGGLQLLSVPKAESLPRVPPSGVFVQRPVPWSYYQNAVTSSYSYAWWGWERWEKEIDWMALQGINLPLAFNGQEAIWKKVFERDKLRCVGPETSSDASCWLAALLRPKVVGDAKQVGAGGREPKGEVDGGSAKELDLELLYLARSVLLLHLETQRGVPNGDYLGGLDIGHLGLDLGLRVDPGGILQHPTIMLLGAHLALHPCFSDVDLGLVGSLLVRRLAEVGEVLVVLDVNELLDVGMATTWRLPPRYNISHSDLDDFFGGPAFLAWSRMGNLHG
ncbi:hypothetical protein ZIOFF_024557 [Zingiber officinale]|uniref:Uncharacterized protein n=1 Tax=Zingiber officinale TaxID=94328 RepID=A0A8J5GWI8_ZINOF|nr:hypothetical protein ZIOFF_024557 [Zingiber officinale]